MEVNPDVDAAYAPDGDALGNPCEDDYNTIEEDQLLTTVHGCLQWFTPPLTGSGRAFRFIYLSDKLRGKVSARSFSSM